jgi:hypothetical protein
MPKRGLSPTSWKKSNIKQETTMRNIILALVGAALLAGPASQVAFAKERHHVHHERQFNIERFRDSNAYAVPSYVPAPGTDYSGEGGAWQSMTGFN